MSTSELKTYSERRKIREERCVDNLHVFPNNSRVCECGKMKRKYMTFLRIGVR